MAVRKQLTDRQQAIIDYMVEDVKHVMIAAVRKLHHEDFVGTDLPYFDARDTVEDVVAQTIEDGGWDA